MGIESLPPVRADGLLNVIVETPRGSTVKIKFDPACRLMTLSRPLPSGLAYPFDWGFVPGTLAADGDPLDAMLLWDCTGYPGLLVPCRPIAVLHVDQLSADRVHRERNDRLLVVPGKSPRLDHLRSADDVPARTLAELEQFFLAAVAFERKDVKLLGWDGAEEAAAAVQRAARQPPRDESPAAR